MGPRPLKTLVLVVAALVTALVWRLTLEASAPAPPTAAAEEAPGTPLADPTGGTGDRPLAEAPGEARAAAESEVVRARAEEAGGGGLLRGRVLSELGGSPLPGARVTVTRRVHSEFMIPDSEERDARRPVAVVVADEEGRFEVAVPAAVPLDVAASASEHATGR